MKYKVTIKVEEEGGGYLERTYKIDTAIGYIEDGDFEERVEDMIDTLEKSKEVKF